MPRKKEIIENCPVWSTFSLFSVLSILDTTKTNKYTIMLLNIFEKKLTDSSNQEDTNYFINELKSRFGFDMSGYTQVEISILFRFIDVFFDSGEIEVIQKFIELNEKKIANGVDVQNINSFSDLNNYLSVATLKSISKKLTNQVKLDYEDEEWLIVRPITLESSVKYGAGTKWCTTSTNNPEHFFRYTREGCLLYVINKNTGLKVACYKNSKENDSVQFYNQNDDRVDSLIINLPDKIFSVLKNIIISDTVSNKELNTKMWIKSESLSSKNEPSEVMVDWLDSPTEPPRIISIDNN